MSKEKEIIDVAVEIDVDKNNKLARIRFASLVISGIGIITSIVCTHLKDRNYNIHGEIDEDGNLLEYPEMEE